MSPIVKISLEDGEIWVGKRPTEPSPAAKESEPDEVEIDIYKEETRIYAKNNMALDQEIQQEYNIMIRKCTPINIYKW